MSEEMIRSLGVWQGEIQIAPLDGGLTNLNYRVIDGACQYAVRAGVDDPRLGIDRRNELACNRVAASLGIAPTLSHASRGVMVSAFVDGEALTPETARRPDRIVRAAGVIRSAHQAGPSVTGHLQYFSPFQVVRTYVALARDEGLTLPTDRADDLLDEVSRLEQRIEPFVPTFCHNDLMPGNLLDAGDKIWLIDWEYGGIGHPLFDLGGFASNCDLDASQDSALLAAYGASERTMGVQFRVMKAMAALRESLWAVVKGADSEIDFDYDGYRDDSYGKYRSWLAEV